MRRLMKLEMRMEASRRLNSKKKTFWEVEKARMPLVNSSTSIMAPRGVTLWRMPSCQRSWRRVSQWDAGRGGFKPR